MDASDGLKEGLAKAYEWWHVWRMDKARQVCENEKKRANRKCYCFCVYSCLRWVLSMVELRNEVIHLYTYYIHIYALLFENVLFHFFAHLKDEEQLLHLLWSKYVWVDAASSACGDVTIITNIAFISSSNAHTIYSFLYSVIASERTMCRYGLQI